ncbi:MAG: histidine triad nucleotide-binding protein [Clostridiales Family XIII bacterium]|jgi:diadenosine tetraphosphate (Ap4A) HIT family hydrolase|nr:histidine triad nucleotide-binding protein [Clostridiales Family XIII bacterium]
MDCIFCKIVGGEIPADVVYEDEEILCFRDLQPQAPIHVLIIPKKHYGSLDSVTESDADKELLGRLMAKVRVIAATLGLENGYRLVCNCGEDGLQTVPHLHFHLLGKRKMQWPPG